MQPDTQDAGGRDDAPQARRTPNTDMQAEDAGTPDSGKPPEADGGSAAGSAMKQTSKTDSESGERR